MKEGESAELQTLASVQAQHYRNPETASLSLTRLVGEVQ